MEDVVGSIFDLMGRTGDPMAEEELINERVDKIFEVSSLFCRKEQEENLFNEPAAVYWFNNIVIVKRPLRSIIGLHNGSLMINL